MRGSGSAAAAALLRKVENRVVRLCCVWTLMKCQFWGVVFGHAPTACCSLQCSSCCNTAVSLVDMLCAVTEWCTDSCSDTMPRCTYDPDLKQLQVKVGQRTIWLVRGLLAHAVESHIIWG